MSAGRRCDAGCGATRCAPRCGTRSAQVGAALLLLLVLLAVFAPLIAPYGPNEVLLDTGVKVREPPCVHLFGCSDDQPQHIMGIDGNGRDEFSRIVYGARRLAAVGRRRASPSAS